MKKSIILFFLITFVAFSVPAYKDQHKMLGMAVSATHDKYHKITINTYNDDSIYGSDGIGMPFDLTGQDVQFVGESSTAGREIGEWSLHSNYTPVTIRIEAQNMVHVDQTVENKSIGYILYFPYEFETINKTTGKTETITDFMMVKSISKDGEVYESTDEPISRNDIQSVNTGFFPIRFTLQEGVNLDDYNSGSYIGNVYVTVEGRNL